MRPHNNTPITSPDDVRIHWPKERGTGIYIAVALTLDKNDTIDHQLLLIPVERKQTLDRDAERLILKRLHELAAGAFIMQVVVYRLSVETITKVYPFADLQFSTDFVAVEESERLSAEWLTERKGETS